MKMIFMLGHAHAGNTWLQNWLSDHPFIFTAFESRIFYSLHNLYEDISSRTTSWHDKLGAECIIRKIAINILSSSPNYDKQALILEMTPGHSEFLWFINMLFPDAYFLITQRDGRRVIASKKKRSIKRSNSYTMEILQYDINLWVNRTKQIISVHPKNNLHLPYTLLCNDSKPWGNQICKFLKIQQHKDLVAWEMPWQSSYNAVFMKEKIYAREDKGENFWMEYLTPDEIESCKVMLPLINELQH